MGENKLHVDAPPEKVFAHLTKVWEDADPSPLKVGDHFTLAGKDGTFTVTLMEAPTRFAISALTKGNVTTTAEYTILPDGEGSMVRVEMDQRTPRTPGVGLLLGGLLEGRQERHILKELKETVEREKASS
jgi:hypothetical protein